MPGDAFMGSSGIRTANCHKLGPRTGLPGMRGFLNWSDAVQVCHALFLGVQAPWILHDSYQTTSSDHDLPKHVFPTRSFSGHPHYNSGRVREKRNSVRSAQGRDQTTLCFKDCTLQKPVPTIFLHCLSGVCFGSVL